MRRRLIGRTKGGLKLKFHVLTEAKGLSIRKFLSTGQTADYVGARALPAPIPKQQSCSGTTATKPTGTTIH